MHTLTAQREQTNVSNEQNILSITGFLLLAVPISVIFTEAPRRETNFIFYCGEGWK
jgi:hypothetical protein